MRRIAAAVGLLILVVGCTSDDGPAPVETGTIKVIVVTGGTDQDIDGYAITIGEAAPKPVAPNGEITSASLPSGTYEVLLSGLAGNCVLSGLNPLGVQVAAGAQADASFNVTCLGSAPVTVTSIMTGPGPAPSTYLVQVLNTDNRVSDGDYDFHVPAAGTSASGTLIAGNYLSFTSIQGNCYSLQNAAPAFTVSSGTPLDITLNMRCDPSRQFAAVRGTGAAREIVLQESDGTSYMVLTNNMQADYNPAWSPDGARLAFTSERNGSADIYVMDADGGNVQQLTSSSQPFTNSQPTWSPDGLHIAFVSTRGGKQDIYVMAADGTDPERITDGGAPSTEPAWSPTGNQILFVRGAAIHIMNADGSGTAQLTAAGTTAVSPSWAPSGTRFAFMQQRVSPDPNFARFCVLHIMNADGTGDVALAAGSGVGQTHSSWGTNGRIAYGTGYDLSGWGDNDWVEAVSPDGTGVNNLLPSGDAPYGQPAWRP